jgi:hypothetical protein
LECKAENEGARPPELSEDPPELTTLMLLEYKAENEGARPPELSEDPPELTTLLLLECEAENDGTRPPENSDPLEVTVDCPKLKLRRLDNCDKDSSAKDFSEVDVNMEPLGTAVSEALKK